MQRSSNDNTVLNITVTIINNLSMLEAKCQDSYRLHGMMEFELVN